MLLLSTMHATKSQEKQLWAHIWLKITPLAPIMIIIIVLTIKQRSFVAECLWVAKIVLAAPTQSGT